MTHADAVTHTEDFRRRAAASLGEGLAGVADAVARAGWDIAAAAAGRVRDSGEHLPTAVVRDMLAAGVNWWRIGDLLSMHPQAVFEQFASTSPPRRPRPSSTRSWPCWSPPGWRPGTTGLTSSASTSRTWAPSTVCSPTRA